MSRTKQKKSPIAVLFTFIVVVIIIVALAYFFVWGPVKNQVVDKVADKAITSVAEQAGVDSTQATELYNSMSEEDQETVQDMIEEHADAQTVQEAIDLYKSGDTAALKDMAREELTDEEINQVKELYEKYLNN
ncbi:MAG: hypothetical protein K6F30_03665 [Lachnospiraceae bacterium]|nr:hypothetical protein [Lachnospiraceae bacterium]